MQNSPCWMTFFSRFARFVRGYDRPKTPWRPEEFEELRWPETVLSKK